VCCGRCSTSSATAWRSCRQRWATSGRLRESPRAAAAGVDAHTRAPRVCACVHACMVYACMNVAHGPHHTRCWHAPTSAHNCLGRHARRTRPVVHDTTPQDTPHHTTHHTTRHTTPHDTPHHTTHHTTRHTTPHDTPHHTTHHTTRHTTTHHTTRHTTPHDTPHHTTHHDTPQNPCAVDEQPVLPAPRDWAPRVPAGAGRVGQPAGEPARSPGCAAARARAAADKAGGRSGRLACGARPRTAVTAQQLLASQPLTSPHTHTHTHIHRNHTHTPQPHIYTATTRAPPPGGLSDLVSLGLRSNCLTALPDELGGLTALTYLDASMNHIRVRSSLARGALRCASLCAHALRLR
jgi:hypothetical protein